jgi:hypothetical protein
MKVFVICSQDRWGEGAGVVAAFSDATSADAFARSETARTHALAESSRDLTKARIYFVTELVIDRVETELHTTGYAAPALTDAVRTNGDISEGLLQPRDGR